MNCPKKERRKYERYDTEAKIYFYVNYDIKTKVRFRVIDKDKERFLSKKYLGLSRDVSAEGIRFSSNKKLKRGDRLYLEIYLPRQKDLLWMTAEVRWSKIILSHPKDKYKFDSGAKLISILGKSVTASIHYDKEHNIVWNTVLESIFGNFRKFVQRNIVKKGG